MQSCLSENLTANPLIFFLIFSSMTFVFLSLLELAVVGYLSKNLEAKLGLPRKHRAPDGTIMWTRTSSLFDEERPKPPPPSKAKLTKVRYKTIERTSRGKLDIITVSWACVCSHYCNFWEPEKIDKFSAVFFPTAFFCFNIFYWGYYVSLSDTYPPDLWQN